MKLEEPAAAYTVNQTVDPLVARAEALVREFRECFWFRHPDAKVRNRDDVPLVIKHLREYGDKRAWRAAQELRKCL
jgi:hypothetical protein